VSDALTEKLHDELRKEPNPVTRLILEGEAHPGDVLTAMRAIVRVTCEAGRTGPDQQLRTAAKYLAKRWRQFDQSFSRFATRARAVLGGNDEV